MEPGSSSSSLDEKRVSAVGALEVVILIGLQGAGKSTFRSQRFAETHAVVSKDLLRDDRRPERRQRLLILAALASGMSVVVDNTNPSVGERASIIDAAHAVGANVRGYFFDSPLPECAARNDLRPERTRVPGVGLFATAKRLVRPSRSEGFGKISTVRTLPDRRFEIAPYDEPDEPDECGRSIFSIAVES
jgi:predicted kinase